MDNGGVSGYAFVRGCCRYKSKFLNSIYVK